MCSQVSAAGLNAADIQDRSKQQTIIDGIASYLGVGAQYVKILRITSRSRRSSSVDIEYEISFLSSATASEMQRVKTAMGGVSTASTVKNSVSLDSFFWKISVGQAKWNLTLRSAPGGSGCCSQSE